MNAPFKKFRSQVVKALKPLAPVLNIFRFLRPSFPSIIILLGLFTLMILFMVFTTASKCRLTQDVFAIACEETTITGLPFWLNGVIGFGIAYGLSSAIYYLYRKLFNKSLIYK